MTEWVRVDRLTVRDRASLNNKIKRLRQMDFDLAIGTKLLPDRSIPTFTNLSFTPT